jgi:hypothetical protein
VEVAFVDQGYTSENAEADAADHGIHLEVVKLPEAKRGFVLLPRRWVVERSFAWLTQFRRLTKDYERLPEILAGMNFIASSLLMLRKAAPFLTTCITRSSLRGVAAIRSRRRSGCLNSLRVSACPASGRPSRF